MTTHKVTVVGSLNYDFMFNQDRLPHRGETFHARGLVMGFGGKGANQAVQIARLGAEVSFIGAVGDDPHGRRSRDNLKEQGVIGRLRQTPTPTGVGVVHITSSGEVFATVFEGANREVDLDWIDANADEIRAADIVIIQNEIPMESNERVVEIASTEGVPVVYNAAPARPVEPQMLSRCHWLVVNEEEAGFYLGAEIGDPSDSAAMEQAVRRLSALCSNVVLTLGRHGCYVVAGGLVDHIPPVPVQAVDTTGAGDSFIGAFTVGLLDGRTPRDAAHLASRVASMTILATGAQTSMPTIEELQREAVRAPSADS